MIDRNAWCYIYDQINKNKIKEIYMNDIGIGKRLLITYYDESEDMLVWDEKGEVTYVDGDGKASTALRGKD